MIENIINKYEYYKNISLKRYNTYKLDVMCEYLIYPKNIEELLELLKYLKENKIKYLILGNGSNVILAKPSFDVVIKLDRLNNIDIKDNIVTASSGVSLIKLSNLCMEKGLNGLAFAGGIPGLLGASVAMNAGAYKEDMASIVRDVKVITPRGEIITMKNSELEYSYRDSFLKRNKEYICIEATLELKYENKELIRNKMIDRRDRRISSQPVNMPSAGSVFRNPPNLSAGKLIEDLGLKGYTIGGAQISEKHANFIINKSNATYDDIISLIEYIKKKVKEKYDIDLILEQEIVR